MVAGLKGSNYLEKCAELGLETLEKRRAELTVQYARTDPRKYSFAVRTVESWNRLPESVKSGETGESFKRRLRGQQE